MSVTIKDIAKLANVSHTTVSRALNDSPLINLETKQKIKALAEELNYSPNYSARSLVQNRSYNIGLFFSTLNTGTSPGFFYDTVRGVNSVVKDRYNLVVKGIDDYHHFKAISKRNFDGIILMSQSADDNRFIQHVMAQGIPQVVLNRYIEETVTNILSDDQTGARNIVKHLIQQGHRDIAIIEGKEGFHSSKARKEGYLDALREAGIPVNPQFQVKGSYNLESGYEAMRKLLCLQELPTAVFCSNDEMAVGAMKAIMEKGLEVPKHLSVAGFDDNGFSGFITPALTTVKRPIEQVSRKGANTMLEFIEKKQTPGGTIYMNTELVIRESVASR